MNKLLEKEYFHSGTDTIYKELWLYPQMDQKYKSYIKPYGGLWCSNINDISLSDWIAYKEDECSPEEIEYLHNLKNCLIKFKKNSKYISINNSNDYKNLKNSGFVKKLNNPIKIDKYYYIKIINEIIDYEKLSTICDLIYVNPNSHSNLSNYSVKTMFALNPESIEYFKPIKVDYENHIILTLEEKKYLTNPNRYFYLLSNYIENLFYKIKINNYSDFIDELYSQKESINKFLFNIINEDDMSLINIPNEYKKLLIETIVNNIYRDKYLEKQKLLIKK